MTDLEFLKFVLYGDKYYESIMRGDDESEPATSTEEGEVSVTPVSDSSDSSEAESSQKDNGEVDERPADPDDNTNVDDQSSAETEEQETAEDSEENKDGSSQENSEQNNVEAEVSDSDVPDPSSNAEINRRIDNMVTGYISNINQGMSGGFKIKTKDSSGQPVTTKTKISAVPLEGSKPVLDQQNKTLKFKIKINKDSSGETGMSKFLRGANAALGGVVNAVK